VLQWHKHNVDKALADLPNYTSYPDVWTIEDKVLFEQAFYVHGKNFQRIASVVCRISCLIDNCWLLIVSSMECLDGFTSNLSQCCILGQK